jgi:hypothetical protein
MFTPPDIIPWFVEGVDILLAGADNYLVTAPFTPSSANTSNMVFSYRIADDLTMQGRMDWRVTGQEARRLRVHVVDEDEADLDDIFKEELADVVPGAELDSVTWKNLSDGYKPLDLGCVLRYPSLTMQANRLLIKPCDYLAELKNPFYTGERKNGILFPYGHERRESAQFEIPDGWTVEAMPGDSVFSNGIGKCGVQFTNFGNTISVQRTFFLNAPFWGVQSYSAVKQLFQTSQDFNNLMVVLAKSTAAGSSE